MSTIFGNLNLNDTDRVFNATQGQRVIYDAVMEYVNRVNAEISAAYSVFISETTANYKERYHLPGSGYRSCAVVGCRKSLPVVTGSAPMPSNIHNLPDPGSSRLYRNLSAEVSGNDLLCRSVWRVVRNHVRTGRQ